MSGLQRPTTVQESRVTVKGVVVDPLVDVTQPGGPYDYGEAILTDGAGNYTIAPTLRPYLLGFTLRGPVPDDDYGLSADYQGISTARMGLVLPFQANLIAITLAVSEPSKNSYVFEVVQEPAEEAKVLSGIVLEQGERKVFRRDLSVEIEAGSELGVCARLEGGEGSSFFDAAIIGVELEI